MSLSPKAFDSILATGNIKRTSPQAAPPTPDPLFSVQSLNAVAPVEYESLDAALAALQRAKELTSPQTPARTRTT
jgi:hypothetical protein